MFARSCKRGITLVDGRVHAGSWGSADNVIGRYDVKEPSAAAEADADRQPGVRTEERLLRHLVGGEFDVDARGVDRTNTTVTVRIQFLLLRIQGLVSRHHHHYYISRTLMRS